MQLLTYNEQTRQNLYFKHIVEGLLRGDAKSRADFYKTMFSIGAMSLNEIREKEDMNPIDDGDKHYVPLNMKAIEDPEKEPLALPPANPEIDDQGNKNLNIETKGRKIININWKRPINSFRRRFKEIGEKWA